MKRLAPFAAVLATIFASPAFAVTSSSASLSNFTYTLTDLDTTDGITPSLVWLDSDYAQVYGNVFDSTQEPRNQSYNQEPSDGFMPISGSISTLLSQVGSATFGVDFGSAKMQASGSTIGAGEGTSYYGVSRGFSIFRLSGLTQVNFSALAIAQVDADQIANPIYEDSRASATASIDVAEVNGSASSREAVRLSVPRNNQNPVTGEISQPIFSESVTRRLMLSFSNTESANLYASLLGQAYVDGQARVVAVPEPETYTMLLAGLALVGFTAKRKKLH